MQAYEQLTAEGYLASRAGSGTSVALSAAPAASQPQLPSAPPAIRLDFSAGAADLPPCPARRAALLAWARQRGGLIIEDDYDAEYRYDRRPVGALQGLDPDHVAYLGSTSKTLSPALRLGWLITLARWHTCIATLRPAPISAPPYSTSSPSPT